MFGVTRLHKISQVKTKPRGHKKGPQRSEEIASGHRSLEGCRNPFASVKFYKSTVLSFLFFNWPSLEEPWGWTEQSGIKGSDGMQLVTRWVTRLKSLRKILHMHLLCTYCACVRVYVCTKFMWIRTYYSGLFPKPYCLFSEPDLKLLF